MVRTTLAALLVAALLSACGGYTEDDDADGRVTNIRVRCYPAERCA